MNGYLEENVRWVMIASIERSIVSNRIRMRPKVASLRVGFGATVAGICLSVVAALLHFWN